MKGGRRLEGAAKDKTLRYRQGKWLLALLVFARRTDIGRCHRRKTRDRYELDVKGHQMENASNLGQPQWPPPRRRRHRHLRFRGDADADTGAVGGAFEAGVSMGHYPTSRTVMAMEQGERGALFPVEESEPRYLSTRSSSKSSTCASRAVHSTSRCNFRNHQTVEWEYGDGDDASACGDELLPESTEIVCDHVAWWSAEGMAITACAIVGIGVSLLFWVGLSRYRKSRALRLGQPRLCVMIIAGIGISCLGALTLPGKNTGLTCASRVWVWSVGFDLTFGALSLQRLRVLSVVEEALVYRTLGLTTRKVTALLVLLLLGDMGILTTWTFTEGGLMYVDDTVNTTGGTITRVSCSTRCDTCLGAWIALKVTIVAFCCLASYRTRKIRSALGESGSAIAMAIYNLAMVGLLLAFVHWAGATVQVLATAEALAIVIVGVGTLCAILGPKLLIAKEEFNNKALVGPMSHPVSANDDEVDSDDPRYLFSFQRAMHAGVRVGGDTEGEAGTRKITKGSGNERVVSSSSNKTTVSALAELVYPPDSARGAPVTLVGDGGATTEMSSSAQPDGKRRSSRSGGSSGLRSSRRPFSAARTVTASDPTSPTCEGEGMDETECKMGSGRDEIGGERRGSGGGGGATRLYPVATALYTTPPTSKHNQSGGVDDYSGAGDGDDSGDDSDTSSVEDTREPGAQCARVSKFFPPMGVPPTVAGGVDSIDQNPTTVDERGRVEMREGYRRQGTRGSSIDSGVCASDGRPRSEQHRSRPPLGGRSRSGHRMRGPLGSGSSFVDNTGSRNISTCSSPTDNGSHRSHASPSSRGSRQSGSLGRGGVGGGTEDGENCAAKDHQAVESGAAAAKNSSVNNRARAVVEKSQAFSVLPLDLAMMFNGGNSSAPPVGDTPNKGADTGGSNTPVTTHDSGLLSSVMSSSRRTLKRRAYSASRVGRGSDRDNDRTGSSLSLRRGGSGRVGDDVRGKRMSAAGSLVMFADSGTRLFCPHCNEEVAGCGFKGCSGSLVRPPSFSDEDIMADGYRSSAPPAFPPLSGTGGSSAKGGAGGSKGGADSGASPPLSTISSKLRLSFRWRSPANTFDNEEDSTDYDDTEGVDGSSPRLW